MVGGDRARVSGVARGAAARVRDLRRAGPARGVRRVGARSAVGCARGGARLGRRSRAGARARRGTGSGAREGRMAPRFFPGKRTTRERGPRGAGARRDGRRTWQLGHAPCPRERLERPAMTGPGGPPPRPPRDAPARRGVRRRRDDAKGTGGARLRRDFGARGRLQSFLLCCDVSSAARRASVAGRAFLAARARARERLLPPSRWGRKPRENTASVRSPRPRLPGALRGARRLRPPPFLPSADALNPPLSPPSPRGSRSQTSSTTSRRSRATAAARRSSSSSSTASMTSSAARGRAWTCARRPGAGSRWRRSTCR